MTQLFLAGALTTELLYLRAEGRLVAGERQVVRHRRGRSSSEGPDSTDARFYAIGARQTSSTNYANQAPTALF